MVAGFAYALLSTASKLIASLRISPSSSSSSDPQAAVLADLQHLERTLRMIQAAICEEEQRGMRGESATLRLQELTGVLYDAEDVLDEYQYDMLRSQFERRAAVLEPPKKRKRADDDDYEVSHNAPSFPFVPMSDGVIDKLRKIRERFDEITKEWEALELPDDDTEWQCHAAKDQPPLPTSSVLDESRVYGREDDKKEVTRLIFSDIACKFSIFPIVGMGGLGKTTLAQLIYKDEDIHREFNLLGWTSVSQDFDVIQLTMAIIETFSGEPCNRRELSTLQEDLKNQVMGKRVFLVLDNVWNEDRSCWEKFQIPFLSAEIVRIVVTTRNHSVAKIMPGVVTPYTLGCLSEGDCWLLFQRCAFGGRVPHERSNLVQVGKQIVQKCKGLPLAVKALGGVLRYETCEEMWRDVLETELWQFEDDNILPALAISYNHMQRHLKPCFLFCSLYSKNHDFEKDKLIRLWMAQGYIESRGSKHLEDVGLDYFDELEARSFFQLSVLGKDIFVMHDMVHDLACSISGKDCSRTRLEDSVHGYDLPNDARHLRVIDSREDRDKSLDKLLFLHKPKLLRTFLFENPLKNRISDDVPLINLQYLRVLKLIDYQQEVLSETVGSLKHLRYLELSYNLIKTLPRSMCHLYNLQTLDLSGCAGLAELPNDIGNLGNLRYLYFGSMNVSWVVKERLPESICLLGNLQHLYLSGGACLPIGFGKLTNLRTLSGFNVGRDRKHCGGIRELKHMVNLRELSMTGLENVVDMEDTKDVILRNKSQLNSLHLNWEDELCRHGAVKEGKECIMADGEIEVAVLRCLQPHSNITKLFIWYYGGTRYPSWLGDPSFSQLTEVNLTSNRRCKSLPPFGQLPSLKTLQVFFMGGLQKIGREFCCDLYSENIASTAKASASFSDSCFPSLEGLMFAYMTELEDWSGVLDRDFPKLHTLNIMECPKLRILPCIHSLRLLIITGCHKLRSLTLQEKADSQSALEEVTFENCSQLKSVVGMGYLTSLKSLTIVRCPRLEFSLDERMQSLPKNVVIDDCPGIKQWCRMHGFKDWADDGKS